ncbi:MAG: hypothetical protein NTW30_03825 [Candidatus Aenigmarchaeota archaeon]|nr:hypothetical protein [Candidatus Aenigmarchaeota archaeon]
MTKKLLYVARIHNIPTFTQSILKFIDREKFVKATKKIEEINNNCWDTVLKKLENYETIDSAFFEGLFDERIVLLANYGGFSCISNMTPKKSEVCTLLLVKGARFEIAEDAKSHTSHVYFEKLRSLSDYWTKIDWLHRLLRPYYHIYGELVGRASEIFVRQRDYYMGKRVSQKLRGVGFLSFGASHNPLGYVKLLAPDVTFEPLYSYTQTRKDWGALESYLKTLVTQKQQRN